MCRPSTVALSMCSKFRQFLVLHIYFDPYKDNKFLLVQMSMQRLFVCSITSRNVYLIGQLIMIFFLVKKIITTMFKHYIILRSAGNTEYDIWQCTISQKCIHKGKQICQLCFFAGIEIWNELTFNYILTINEINNGF